MDVTEIILTITITIFLCIFFYKRNVIKKYCNVKWTRTMDQTCILHLKESRKNRGFLTSINMTNALTDHRQILLQLHNAAEKCNVKFYALKCINLVSYCPHLVNIALGPEQLTPFHKVCFYGHTCLIEYMLAKGADPFLTTQRGENALCMALYHFLNDAQQNYKCLNVLYEAGCHLHINTPWYNMFIKAAIHTNNKSLAQWILTHNKAANHSSRCTSEPPISEIKLHQCMFHTQ